MQQISPPKKTKTNKVEIKKKMKKMNIDRDRLAIEECKLKNTQ